MSKLKGSLRPLHAIWPNLLNASCSFAITIFSTSSDFERHVAHCGYAIPTSKNDAEKTIYTFCIEHYGPLNPLSLCVFVDREVYLLFSGLVNENLNA